jgi:hypothetical protein
VTPEGRYTATIVAAAVETDPYDPDGLVISFVCSLPDGSTVEPRHSTTGDYAKITKQIIEGFGLTWPQGVAEIGSVVGKTVPVSIKNKTRKDGTEYQKAYIATARKGEPADAATVKRNLAKISGDTVDDDTPF